jgi:outer membrane protein TolC
MREPLCFVCAVVVLLVTSSALAAVPPSDTAQVVAPAAGTTAAVAAPAAAPEAAPIAQGPSQQFTFESAYQGIIDRSLRLQAQRLELDASEYRKTRQWSTFSPRFDVSYSDTSAGDSYSRLQGAALNARVNLFRSFGDVNGLRAADKNIEGTREKLLVERQNAEDDALQILATYIARVAQREIGEKTVQLKADSARIARERFDRGLLPMQEVSKVTIDLDNARAALADTLIQETDARAKLISALGSDQVKAEWPWKEVISNGLQIENAALVLEARPDWRAALASVAEEKYRTKQTFGTLLPSLDFTASYGSADLSMSSRRDWNAIWTFSMPLFTGFQDYAAYKIQSVSQRQAEVRLELLKRQATIEIENLRVTHLRARETAIAREKTAKVTEQLYADNQRRFQMGRANANDLELDLNRLLNSQLLEVDGWLAAHLTLAKLCHGHGGFISADGACSVKD